MDKKIRTFGYRKHTNNGLLSTIIQVSQDLNNKILILHLNLLSKMTGNSLSTEFLVWDLDHGLVNRPFTGLTHLQHSNAGLVWYSDLNCM